jgi:hypothetical protein
MSPSLYGREPTLFWGEPSPEAASMIAYWYCTSQFKVERTKRGEKKRKKMRRGNEEEGRANTVYACMQVCGELVI